MAGPEARARAMATRWACPPERAVTGRRPGQQTEVREQQPDGRGPYDVRKRDPKGTDGGNDPAAPPALDDEAWSKPSGTLVYPPETL